MLALHDLCLLGKALRAEHLLVLAHLRLRDLDLHLLVNPLEGIRANLSLRKLGRFDDKRLEFLAVLERRLSNLLELGRGYGKRRQPRAARKRVRAD